MDFIDSRGNQIQLNDFISQKFETGKHIYIGTDSKNTVSKTKFTTAVVIYTSGRGGVFCLSHRSINPRMPSTRQRLLQEALFSIEVANIVSDMVPTTAYIEIHLDVSAPNLKFESSKHQQMLSGFVIAQGYPCKWKPDSWCATGIADHAVRAF